jgi:2,3-bisphosphoglycerate-dependent phosphoglycerate mutase
MQNRSAAREVWFIRHGESLANAGGRTKETATCPLTELGLRQSQQLAAALPAEPEFIVHSTYLRARQTAEPTMERFCRVPVDEWTVQEVQYLDPVLCVDTTQDDRRLLAQSYWQQCEPHHAPPGAESFAFFIERARATMAALSQRRERLTYVFSHGHFIRAIAWTILFRPSALDVSAMQHFRQFMASYPVPNCAIVPLYLHETGAHSLGALWVPDGLEREHCEPVPSYLVGL